jgi:hypothetical protein
MATTTLLLNSDIDAGLRLLDALDGAGFGVVAALWVYNGDDGQWTFVIAAQGASHFFSKIGEAINIIRKWRESHPDGEILDITRIKLVAPDDPLVLGLSPIVEMNGRRDVRVSHRLVNGIYLEDALIHRMAA